jgi:hypothetical protein
MEISDSPLVNHPFVPLNDGTDRFIVVTIDNEVVLNVLVPRFSAVEYKERMDAIFSSNPTFTLHNVQPPIGSTFPPA